MCQFAWPIEPIVRSNTRLDIALKVFYNTYNQLTLFKDYPQYLVSLIQSIGGRGCGAQNKIKQQQQKKNPRLLVAVPYRF